MQVLAVPLKLASIDAVSMRRMSEVLSFFDRLPANLTTYRTFSTLQSETDIYFSP